jgi:predicted transcriptional regulator
MSKMKELLMDILEAYDEERLPVSMIAERFEMSVDQVQLIIDEWSDVMAKA